MLNVTLTDPLCSGTADESLSEVRDAAVFKYYNVRGVRGEPTSEEGRSRSPASPRRPSHAGGPEDLGSRGFPKVERKRARVTTPEARANVQYYADIMDGIKPELSDVETSGYNPYKSKGKGEN